LSARGAKPLASGGKASQYVFTDAPVSFGALHGRNADGELALERLPLAPNRALDRVHAKFSLRNGKLDAPAVQASAYGGTITGSVTIDAMPAKAAAVTVRADARGLDLAALLAAAGV